MRLRLATGHGTWMPALRPMGRRSVQWHAPLVARHTPGSPRRWVAWATQLLGRYAIGGALWDQLAMIMRSMLPTPWQASPAVGSAHSSVPRLTPWPPFVTLHLVTSAVRQLVTPHLAARVPTDTPQSAGALVPGLAPVSYPARPHLVPVIETTVSRQHELWLTQRRIQRLTQHEFALPQAHREDTPSPTDAWVTAVPPVPRVVASPPAAALTTASAPEKAMAAPAPLQYWEETPRPTVFPALEVEHLTDQVIRAIDQRVIAARERLDRR